MPVLFEQKKIQLRNGWLFFGGGDKTQIIQCVLKWSKFHCCLSTYN